MLAMLSACGFRLRSATQTSLPFKTIYLHFPESSAIGVELKRYIRASGSTEIVNDPKLAEAIVEIVQPERKGRVVLSMNGAAQPVEYELSYSFSFRVHDNQDRELLPATSKTVTFDTPYNVALALAKETEITAIYVEMQSEMVQYILRRLVALKPSAQTAH